MKTIYTILAAILLSASVFLPQQVNAQAPEKMSYQAVIRNSSDQLVTNQGIGMQISILQTTATGSAVYVETHNTTTNANGLVTLEIGNGTVVSGDFVTINWANDIYFIKTKTDPTTAGGTTYTITGISQLLSVAYALHAKTADNTFSGDYVDLANTPDLTNYDQNVSDDFDGQYGSLTGTPTNVSDFTNNAGYITTFSEVDGSITNEIQDLQLTGNILTITNNGTATSIDLSSYLDNTDTQLSDANITTMGYIKNADDADANASNEIQDLQLNSTTNILTITNNGTATSIDLSSYLDNTDIQLTDANITAMGYIKNADNTDADATNEIQDLQLNSTTNILTITDNGTATNIDLSSYLDNTDTQLTDANITAMGYIKNVDNTDADATNEIQDLQLNSTTNILTITNNGTATNIDLSSYLDNTNTQLSDAEITTMGYIKNADDADADATNEIQTLSQVLTQSNDASNIAIHNLKIGQTSICDVNSEGNIRYNSTTQNMEFCNGTEWTPFNPGTPCSPQPTEANAGADQTDIIETITLEANLATEGIGKWTVTSGIGGSFSNINLATSNFTPDMGEAYVLTWTISNACYNSSDNVTISPLTVTDYDGNIYKTVKIGSQIWMSKNLRVTHYADGSEIDASKPAPAVYTNAEWAALEDNNTDKAYCFYNNNINNNYGALYTYAAAINGNSSGASAQGICPTGWHLPTSQEWTNIKNYLIYNGFNYDGTTDYFPNKIAKAMATDTGWNSSTIIGAVGNTDYPDFRNKSGFSALPGGLRQEDNGSFNRVGVSGYWWSASESTNEMSRITIIVNDRSNFIDSPRGTKSVGFSVRCIKD